MKPADGSPCVPGARYAPALAWLDRLIERETLRLRARYELSIDELRGLYISDAQVDALLRERIPDPAAEGRIHRLTQEAIALSARCIEGTPLAAVARRFALGRGEAGLLLLAFAPELALHYETHYAYLNNDIARRCLTADLALRLLADSGFALGRDALAPGARLFDAGLLEWSDAAERRSLLAGAIALAPPLTQALLGLPARDTRLPPAIRLLPPAGDCGAGELPASAAAVIADWAAAQRIPPGLTVCTAETAAEAFVAVRLLAGRRPVLAVPAAVPMRDEAAAQTIARVHALARLAEAVVVLEDDGEAFAREPAALQQLARALRAVLGAGAAVIWTVPQDAPWMQAVVDLPFVELALPAADSADRAAAWHAALGRHGRSVDAAVLESLAQRFPLPRARIAIAAESALRTPSGATPDGLESALWQAARRHSGQSLAQLAERVSKPHTWQHLVLPEATLNQVREVAGAIAQRERVFEDWRMAERTGRGKGLMALFAGASGTGKTMTAAVIARELGYELYRIDLAAVVSKYIGETEKNLDRIFRAARHSNAMLFFDEADALLGKRSEVKDAHDRYANIEVAYLLQKMEDHDGVVILASNLAKNLDQAFARRMQYVVEFPRPAAALRERLWRGMFPAAAPLAGDIDFGFLAAQFDTSGGEIQTIALDAAFLASAEGDVIGMSHLVKAMGRHQLKMGNPGGVRDFRQYHALLGRHAASPA